MRDQRDRDQRDKAFEEFVAGSARRLLLTAILLTGGDQAAGEDLLQGALERTYVHWARMKEPRPEAYVRRALANAATSRWRRGQRRVVEVPLLIDGAWTADPAEHRTDPADQLAAHEALIRALRVLPPRQRAVLVLRYFDDLPETEVAAALRCSVGTVRSQASRGLARLRTSEHLAAFTPAATATATDTPTDAPPAGLATAARTATEAP